MNNDIINTNNAESSYEVNTRVCKSYIFIKVIALQFYFSTKFPIGVINVLTAFEG